MLVDLSVLRHFRTINAFISFQTTVAASKDTKNKYASMIAKGEVNRFIHSGVLWGGWGGRPGDFFSKGRLKPAIVFTI